MTQNANEDILNILDELNITPSAVFNLNNISGAGVSAPTGANTTLFYDTDSNLISYVNSISGGVIGLNATGPTGTQGPTGAQGSTGPTGSATFTATQLISTTPFSTTSATYVTVTSMTITPPAGMYYVQFSGQITFTANDGAIISLFVGGVQITHTERFHEVPGFFIGSPDWATSTQAIVSVDGAETIDLRILATGGGTVLVGARSLILISAN